jgi:hypothetical protein
MPGFQETLIHPKRPKRNSPPVGAADFGRQARK